MDAETELRPDVRLVPRDDMLYVCTSTGTLRVPARLPTSAEDSGTGAGPDTVALRTGAVPDAVVKGLRSRGLAYDSGRYVHPLYGELAVGGDRTVAVAPQALGDELGTLLGRVGVRTVPDGASERAAVTVLPLTLPEEQLVRRTEAALKGGTPLVVYLSTPHPAALRHPDPARHPLPGVSRPPPARQPLLAGHRRPPPGHPVRRRARRRMPEHGRRRGTPRTRGARAPGHHTTTRTRRTRRHRPRRAEPPRPHGVDRARARFTPAHRTPALPPARLSRLRDHVTPLAPSGPTPHENNRTAAPSENADEATGRDDAACWERMRHAVDPLTGMVPQLRVDECDSDLGGATYARTAGMTKTSWFSPVTAEARGGAVKSDPVTARVCAVGETLERYAAGVYDPRRLVRASYTELGEDAVDPRALPLGSAAEYARYSRLAPCDPDARIDWVPGRSLVTGGVRHVPACAVYLPYRFPPGHRAWYDPISTGLAAGSGYHHAVHGGLMEAVERDATVLFWENRLTLPTLDLDTLPEGPARRIVARMRDQGVSVTAKDLTTDLGIPVIGVRFLRHTERRPVVTHAARAGLDPYAALLGALEEGCLGWAGARLWQEHLDAGESIPGTDDVLTSLKEFSLYYWAPDRVRHLEFWDEGPVRDAPAPRAQDGFGAEVKEAAGRLAARGYEAVAVDITPVDVAECGVTVVRTVVPGLCPITLRSDFYRRGGPRVFDAPVAMGVRSTPLTEAELNPLPLPFL
ncbi:YcaO-like family protein [Streptomyces cremeus]|uniref:YcaO-like family protein n=1 Tax=Streptomyces cremeus TaxID=66881 RepID=UPI0031E4E9C8